MSTSDTEINSQPLPVRLFRVFAILEALSWVFLLIAMYFKYVYHDKSLIHNAGMVHGIIFLLFIISAFITSKVQHWDIKVLLWALGSSIPPLCTLVFDLLARNKGYLDNNKAHDNLPS